MKRRIMLVHNQQSGSSVSPRQLRSYFIHAGYEVTSMVAVSSSLAGRIERALHHDPSLAVAAVGGDGTISAVAGILSGTDTPLIPIPGGTLNNFSKDLGISQDLEEAIRQAATAPIRQIDTAEVNGTIFLNNSSIGLYPLSLRTREVAQQKLGKWPAALYGVIKAFIRLRLYEIDMNGTHIRTPFLFVGNNEYAFDQSSSGFGRRDRLDGGRLSVYIIKGTTHWAVVRILIAALFGRLDEESAFLQYPVTSLRITSQRSRTVTLSHDGEHDSYRMPLTYRILPQSLCVIAPPVETTQSS